MAWWLVVTHTHGKTEPRTTHLGKQGWHSPKRGMEMPVLVACGGVVRINVIGVEERMTVR